MGLGLKLFWGAIATALIIGIVYLAVAGVPSPAVDVRKNIDVEKLLR